MKKSTLLFSFAVVSALKVSAGTNLSHSWATNPFDQKVFIQNKGQLSSNILFSASIEGVELYFNPNGLTYQYNELVPMTEKEKFERGSASKKEEEEGEVKMKAVPHNILVEWIGANPNVQVISEEPVSFYYTHGNNFKASAFKKIIYKNIYLNIDAEYIFPSDKSGIKYSLILHPGANPSDIKMKWNGKNISASEDGSLIIKSSFGDFVDHTPQTYYTSGNSIPSSFIKNGNTISFSLSSYDKSKTVIIDPWTTNPTFATNNKAYEVNYDNNGNVYAYGAGATANSPHQLAKFNSAGALQWIFNATAIVSYQNDFGDFTVDKATGNSYIGEGWAGNSGFPTLVEVSTNGTQIKTVFYNDTTNKKAVFEFWRLEFNECNKTILCGTGGLPSSIGCNNTQAVVFDLNLNKVVNQTSVVSTQDGVDVQLLAIDKYSCCQYGYLLTNFSSYTSNKCPLVKMSLSNLSQVWKVNTTHKFGEAYTLYKGTLGVGGPCNSYGGSNGYNGIAISPAYVYTYDSDSIFRWDKNTGALVASAHVSSTTPTYSACWLSPGSINIYWGGLDVDECDNTYIGVEKDIKVYDLGFNLIKTYNLPDTVYDLHLAPNNKLYASGKGFVTEINNTVATSSTTYNVTTSSTPSSGCGQCNGTANVVATATVTCGAPPVFSYSWAPGGQTTTAISNLCPGNYTVTVASNCFPISTQTVLITGGSVVAATATSSPTTCGNSNGSANVTVTTGNAPYTYSWSPSVGSSSAVSNLAAGNYTVTVTDAGGCSTTQIVSVAPSTNITATAGPASAICAGQTVTLTSSGGNNYSWSNGNTNSSINVSPTATTTYSVIVSNGSCADTASVIVTVNPSPTVSVLNSTICIGDVATLTATGGTNYSWNTGATTASITDNPNSTSTYSVLVSNANGCTATTTATVTVSPAPIASATSATICSGQNASLSASGGGNYNWSNGNTNSSIIISPTTNTTYSVVVSSGGCSDTATSFVAVNPVPTVSVPSSIICVGDVVTLSASGATTYSWSTGVTTASITIAPNTTSSYSVLVSNSNGCTATANATVTVFPPPIASATSATICSGQSASLSASGGGNYNWSNGNTNSSINVSPISNSTYTIIVSVGSCTDTAYSSVTVNPSPSVALGNNQTICDGQNLTLNAGNPGASYIWSTGATSQTIHVSGAGTYWVFVALNNCLAKDTISTFIAPKVHLFDSSLCTTSPIVLDPGSGASGYLWSTGSTAQTISVDAGGNYWVVAIFGNCMSSDSSHITGDGTGGGLFIPNAFTPNDDNLNEIFLAKGTGIESFDMKIFDRWGNLIFISDNINKGWDGKIQGGNYTLKGDGNDVAQEDVYVWKIDYTTQCFHSVIRKEMGHVSIVK